MVKKCFLEMDMLKLKTIAIPTFGTGQLGYPKRETAKAMFDAVDEYQYSCINSSLQRVVFVLYQGDKDTCEVSKSYTDMLFIVRSILFKLIFPNFYVTEGWHKGIALSFHPSIHPG